MPYKYPKKKGWKLRKQKYKLKNWPDYNRALRNRGRIEVWLHDEAIAKWMVKERVYDGSGTPYTYTDFAILTCHELRKVFRLPLRQCQGFIDSLLQSQELFLRCPDYTVLCRRLKDLGLCCPRYRERDEPEDSVAAIALDATGLKRFGRDEWYQEKHQVSANRSWRKLHIAVEDETGLIQSCELTTQYVADNTIAPFLLEQVPQDLRVQAILGDGAYDDAKLYQQGLKLFAEARFVIPPHPNHMAGSHQPAARQHNLLEIERLGRMGWQRTYGYGRRNGAELTIQRYKRILGSTLQSRELSRQQQEAKIGCGILNKMVQLGMPQSYRSF